jgi:large repetitive protein
MIELPPGLRELAVALGALRADGSPDATWLSQPAAKLRTVLSDPTQAAALADGLDQLVAPVQVRGAAAGEHWHPLLDEPGLGGLYLTVRRFPDGLVLGVGGRVTAPLDGDLSLGLTIHLPLLGGRGGALATAAGTADGPLTIEVELGLGLTDPIPLGAVRLRLELAPLAADAPAATVVITLVDLELDGRHVPERVLDPADLGAEALDVLGTLLAGRLRQLAAEAGAPPSALALAQHLLPLLGVGAGLDPIPLGRLLSEPAALRGWLAGVAGDPDALKNWFGHLGGLLGGIAGSDGQLAVDGDGTPDHPFATRLLPLAGAGLDLTLARDGDGDGGVDTLELGVRLTLDAGVARLVAAATIVAIPLRGAGPARPLPDATVRLEVAAADGKALVDSSEVTVGSARAGLRWDGITLLPLIELHGVVFRTRPYDRLDLTHADSVVAAASDALRDVLRDALGATEPGPGRHLAALVGIVAPGGDEGSPLIDPLLLATDPVQAVAAVHRKLLADPGRGWRHLLAEVAGLLGLDGTVAGSGVPDDPWRLPLGREAGLELDLAAWNERTGADQGTEQLRVGLRLGGAWAYAEGWWLSELLAFDLPANGPPAVRMFAAHRARIEVTPPEAPPLAGITLGAGALRLDARFPLGAAPSWQAALIGLRVETAQETVTLPALALPPAAPLDPKAPDLGLGVPAAALAAALRMIAGRALATWGGPTGLVLGALLGLHRDLPGMPDDWPLLEADDPAALLDDPLGALAARLRRVASEAAGSDGRPFVAVALGWLRGLLAGLPPVADLPGEGFLPGAGTADEPWVLPLVDGLDLLAWLEREGRDAAPSPSLPDTAATAQDFDELLTAAARLRPFAASLRAAVPAAGDRAALAEALAALAAHLADSDGVVPVAAQQPAGGGWATGSPVEAAHHLLPRTPAAIQQVAAQVEAWSEASGERVVLLVGPAFLGEGSWEALLTQAETAAPGRVARAGAHFDLTVDPAPAVLEAVTASSDYYTATLADSPQVDALAQRLAAAVGRVRQLRPGRRVILVAHSTAALPARAVAATNPAQVRGLVALGGPFGGAPLAPLRTPALAEAARLAVRLLRAAAATGPLADAVTHLVTALDAYVVSAPGTPPVPLVYPLASFGPATATDTGGVPALALAGRLPGGLLAALGEAVDRLAGAVPPVTAAPTHLAVGLRTALDVPAAPDGDVAVAATVQADVGRVPLERGTAEPARSARRIIVGLSLDRPGGWLVGDAGAGAIPVEARVRRAALGLVLEPGPDGAVRAEPYARFDEAAFRGPTADLVGLHDPTAAAVFGAVMRAVSRPKPAAGTAAAALLDALTALGITTTDPAGGMAVAADALAAITTDPGGYLLPRLRAALDRPEGLLGLAGPAGGPWARQLPGVRLSLAAGEGKWTLGLATTTANGDQPLALGDDAHLSAAATLRLPAFAAEATAAVDLAGVRLAGELPDGSLTAEIPGLAGPVALLPRAPAGGTAALVPALALAATGAALLEAALPAGMPLAPAWGLVAAPGRWLAAGLRGGSGTLSRATLSALLNAAAQLLGQPPGSGLSLPGGLRLTAEGEPATLRLATQAPVAVPGGSLSLGLTVGFDQLLHPSPGGDLALDVELPGDWGRVVVRFGAAPAGLALDLTPYPDGSHPGTPIRILPQFGGLGGAAADAGEALLPAVLDAAVAALPSPRPTLAAVALQLADALGLRGDDPAARSFAAGAARLRALLHADWAAGIDLAHAGQALGGLWSAAGLPGKVATSGDAVTWTFEPAGQTLSLTAGFGDPLRLLLGAGGLRLGPVTLVACTAGYDGAPAFSARLQVAVPAEDLGLDLDPELEVELAGGRFHVELLPLGAGSGDTLALRLAPTPEVVAGAAAPGALLERLLLPLVVHQLLDAAGGLLDEALWQGGPTLRAVLEQAGVLQEGTTRLSLPLPAPDQLALRAIGALAGGAEIEPIENLLVALLVQDGRFAVRLRGHLDISADPEISIRFGEPENGWMPADAGVSLYLLQVDRSTIVFRPGLGIVGLGVRVASADDTPLLDTAAVRLGGAGAYLFAEAELDDGVAVRRFGGAVDLDRLGLPLGQATGGSNPVAGSLLRSDGGSAGGDTAPLNPEVGLVVAKRDAASRLEVHFKGAPEGKPFWIKVQRAFGPLWVDQVGIARTAPPKPAPGVGVLVDGGVKVGGLALQVDDLEVDVPFATATAPATWALDLKGLAVGFRAGAVSIAGGLIKNPGPPIEYDGVLSIEVAGRGFTAIGAYSRPTDELGEYTSLFVFVSLPIVIGGPPYLFITGVAGGAGYNRRLLLPERVTDVPRFPLVAAIESADLANDPMGALQAMGSNIPPQRGSMWLAAGIRFSSFVVVQTTAVVYVAIDRGLEVGLVGVSRMQLPDASAPIANVELALKARFSTAEGLLSVQAQLTDNSWLLSPDCQLTGGFAFFIWFTRAQFVLTLGGYHRSFAKPPAFPDVPRLGFHWAVSEAIAVKGESYFALTSSCVMAGARLEATYQAGGLRAWFIAYADFLVSWDPFSYDIEIGVSIGVSLEIEICFIVCGTVRISVSVGARLHVFGPPLRVEAEVDLEVCTLRVEFGETEPPRLFLQWDQFVTKYLVAGDAQGKSSAVNATGLLPQEPPGGQPAPGTSQQPWLVGPDFSLLTETRMAAGRWDVPGLGTGVVPGVRLDLAPLGPDGQQVSSTHRVRVLHAGSGANAFTGESAPFFTATPQIGRVPEATWRYVDADRRRAAANTLPALTGLRLSGHSKAINVSAQIGVRDLVDEGTRPLPFTVAAGVLVKLPVAVDWPLTTGGLVVAAEPAPALVEQPAPALVGQPAAAAGRHVAARQPGTEARGDGEPPPGDGTRWVDEVPVTAVGRQADAFAAAAGAGATPERLLRMADRVLAGDPAFAAARRAAGLPAAGLPPLARRALRERRSAPPLVVPLAGGLAADPVALPLPPVPDPPPPQGPVPLNRPRLLAALVFPPRPAGTAAPRTTVVGVAAAAGALRTAPPRVPVLAGARLQRVAGLDDPPATTGAVAGSSLRTLETGWTLGPAQRRLVEQAEVAVGGEGVRLAAGAVHLWELPEDAADRWGVRVTPHAAVRLAALDRAGNVLADAEHARLPAALRPPAGTATVVLTCLGAVPDGTVGDGFGAVSAAVAAGGRAVVSGWQLGNLAVQAASTTLLSRGAVLRLPQPAPAAAAGRGTGQALTRLSAALAGQPGVETWLPAVEVVAVLLDRQDPAAAAGGDLALSARHATLATPPLRVTVGERVTLLYEVVAGEPGADRLAVTVGSLRGWTVAGVLGLPGRAEEWAARLRGTVPPQLATDGPLSAAGEVVVTIEDTEGGPW